MQPISSRNYERERSIAVIDGSLNCSFRPILGQEAQNTRNEAGDGESAKSTPRQVIWEAGSHNITPITYYCVNLVIPKEQYFGMSYKYSEEMSMGSIKTVTEDVDLKTFSRSYFDTLGRI